MTRERPILFSAPMVRAILDGRKTQTRRIVRGQDAAWSHLAPEWDVNGDEFFMVAGEKEDNGLRKIINAVRCPYGQPGDRLWVREKWRIGAWNEDKGAWAIDYFDGPRREWLTDPDDDDGERFNAMWQQCCDELHAKGIYPSDGGDRTEPRYHWKPGESPLRWRPSIHMPRWASRITLEIAAVRVERLQDISEADARAEGITDGGCLNCGQHEPCGCNNPAPAPRDTFAGLWREINGDGAWDANPWVWVVEFRRRAA
ncbi:MAG: hypothetical protein J5J04_17280 [Anaerolineae bacterium]|nr:hypothetical protein [Anaerolineae bacterium]